MRNYGYFDTYLDRLQEDIYPQPPDDLQQQYGDEVINDWIRFLPDCNMVLDVGCGQGQFAQTFKNAGMTWKGITLGSDAEICWQNHLYVEMGDFSFLRERDETWDLIFARHCLEHSPFPILTLMEWARVSKKYLCVVLPNPLGLLARSHVGAYRGQNHYSVMTADHFLWLAERAGWHKTQDHTNDFEMRFLLRKGEEVRK